MRSCLLAAVKSRFVKPIQNRLGEYLDRTGQENLSAAQAYVKGRSFPQDDLTWSPLSRLSARVTKRAMDIGAALPGVALLAPMTLIFAPFLISSTGRIFYFQEREGLGGNPIIIPKFKTLWRDFDITDPAGSKENPASWEVQRGTYITKIGRYLRPLGVDEWPQFLPILDGAMTFIGLRAIPKGMLEVQCAGLGAWKSIRRQFKPSLIAVDLALKGNYTASTLEARMLEIYYLGNWSLKMDAKLIFRVLLTIAAGRLK